MQREVSAILLSGGRSARMGQDKARIDWDGKPLVTHMVQLLQNLFQEILLVTGDTPRYTEIVDVPVLPDRRKGLGPLGGIHTGLHASSNDWNLVLACDMPYVRLSLIARLVDEVDDRYKVVVPEVTGYFEPLLALYHKSCLPEVDRLIAAHRLKPIELYTLVPTKVLPHEYIERIDPGLSSFFNLNAPHDLPSTPGSRPRNDHPLQKGNGVEQSDPQQR